MAHSIAEVAADGPFSRFEGIDRSTAILRGEGFRLAFGDGRMENLRLDAPALAYPGDIARIARCSPALCAIST